MPVQNAPENLAASPIRITRVAGALSPSRRRTALRQALLVIAAVGACASAAFAAYGVRQLASTVGVLIELALLAEPAERHVSVPAPISAAVASVSGSPQGPPPAPAPGVVDGRTSRSETSLARGEASESSRPIGAQSWHDYTQTECTGVFVYIVTTFELSPRDSAASLASSKTGPARFRRAGQMLGEWEVLGITDDWTGLNPSVWLVKDNEVCRADLDGNPARVHVALKPPVKKRKPKRRRRRGKRR